MWCGLLHKEQQVSGCSSYSTVALPLICWFKFPGCLDYREFHQLWKVHSALSQAIRFIYLIRQRMRSWAVFCYRSSSKVECPFLRKCYKLNLISWIQILTGPNVASHLCAFKHAWCHLEQVSPITFCGCGLEGWRIKEKKRKKKRSKRMIVSSLQIKQVLNS